MGKRLILLSFFATLLISCSGYESLDKSSSSTGELQSSFSCNPNRNIMRESQSKFLTKLQLQNTIDDLFSLEILNNTEVQNALASLPNELNNDVTHKRESTLDSNKITAYFNIAKTITEQVIINDNIRAQVFGACESETTLSRSCADSFIAGKALEIIRRPLKSNEITSIYEIVDGNDSKQEKLRAMLFSLVGSPFFVWNVELGDAGALSNNFNLNSYEIATKISYKITDSTPDSILLAAAANNSIKDESIMKSQVKRLLFTDKGKDKIVRSILRWAGANSIKDITSLPTDLTADVDTNNLENSMLDEAYKFVNHIVYNQKGTFKDLLLSKSSFASHTGLAKVYNHTPYVEGEEPKTFPDERMGLLLRSPFLTHYSSRSSIINRGVQFQLKVLCNSIPEPNVDISSDRDADARTQEESLFHSNRSNITEMTKSPVCMSCHQVINPTGFALESFDSLGRYRVRESIYSLSGDFQRNVSIDTRTDLPLRNGESVPINSAADLVNFVANSNDGNECFVRNIDRFFNEKEEEASDNCRLEKAFQGLANLNSPIIDVIENIIIDENLRTKRSIAGEQ